MKIKKTAIVIILALLAIILLQNKVLATETRERTTILDLTTSDFANNQSNDEEGWKWEAATNTLTLTNVNFNTVDSGCIKIPTNKNINLVLNGENKLNSTGSSATITRPSSNTVGTALIITGTGKLEINSNNTAPTIDVNNLILKSGTINAIGGSINALESIKIEGGKITVNTSSASIWCDGLYACGSIEISAGIVETNVTSVGLFATGTNKINPTTGIKITGGKINLSADVAGIYAGLDNPKDVYINTTETIDFKDSPIGIYVYSGNLTIDNGNFKVKEGKKGYRINPSNPTGNVTINILADYTKVNQAIAEIPTDLSLYTEESINALNSAKNAVIAGKNIFEQDIVNGYATAIRNAINALSYKEADYTNVNQAIAEIPADLSLYTEESIDALNSAKNAVVTGKNITEQNIVNGYATAIRNAINALSYKEADYTNVNQAIAKIPADLSIYTAESINALNNVKNAVVIGKNITEQNIVDGYATAIENAISALELKKANYAKVDEAIAKIPTNLNKFTLESVKKLNKAIESIVRGKNILQQAEVDMYATKIQEAINNLEEIKKEEMDNNEDYNNNNDNNNNNENSENNNNNNNNNNNENNENSENNNNNNNNENNENSENEANNESNEDKTDTINTNIVKTGDNIVITTILFVIAIAGTIVTFKLNKKANN